MYVNHNNKELIEKLIDIPVSSLACAFENKALYTKTHNNSLIKIGSLYDYLYKLKDVDITDFSNTYILKFNKNIETNEYYLTSVPLKIFLSNLSGTFFVNNSELNYLGLTNNLLIGNIVPPNLTIFELTEVKTNQNTIDYDGYVLTYSYDAGRVNAATKNPFMTSYIGNWELRPDNTKLTSFDNIYYVKETSKKWDIVRTSTKDEIRRNGKVWTIDKFSIYFDKSPKLSNNINYQKNNSYNSQYKTQTYEIQTNSGSISADYISNDVIIINCAEITKQLNIEFVYNLAINSFKPVLLILKNFSGILNFSNSNIVYENGKTPVLTGKNTVFNIVLSDVIKINIKSNNLLRYG